MNFKNPSNHEIQIQPYLDSPRIERPAEAQNQQWTQELSHLARFVSGTEGCNKVKELQDQQHKAPIRKTAGSEQPVASLPKAVGK
jgi:hypothetical protein